MHIPETLLNTVTQGDCLPLLTALPANTIDLCYIDPPYNSGRDYGDYTDTWPSMDHYINYMVPRIEQIHRTLKETGHFYMQCDASASHYLKVACDKIFGYSNFRREIIWRSGWVSGFKSKAKNWIRNHDTILYYLKDANSSFLFDLPLTPHAKDYKRRGGTKTEGIPLDDVWTDIYSPNIMSFSNEKVGYANRKPIKLLERIIESGTYEDEIVLDPMCGSGTTLEAAKTLGCKYIGMDISEKAVALAKERLAKIPEYVPS